VPEGLILSTCDNSGAANSTSGGSGAAPAAVTASTAAVGGIEGSSSAAADAAGAEQQDRTASSCSTGIQAAKEVSLGHICVGYGSRLHLLLMLIRTSALY
jgi:hypothetical protein